MHGANMKISSTSCRHIMDTVTPEAGFKPQVKD